MLRSLVRCATSRPLARLALSRAFGYSLVAVGLSDPLCTSPPAEHACLESGAVLPPLVPILVGSCSHCPSPASLNSVFAVHGSHGSGTLALISDALACAALLQGSVFDLCLFESTTLDWEECRELHQQALALRAPLQRILANPGLVVSCAGQHRHAWVLEGTRLHVLSSAGELWEGLHRRTAAGHLHSDLVPAALQHLTRTLGAASAGPRGILAVDYDR
jgi:hypothetical protein